MSARLWKVSAGCLTIAAGLYAAPVVAQDFSAGKTAAQLFASDCSACHKSPAGLAKGQSTNSLVSFLREHYTTKPASAAALAAYVAGAGPGSARLNPQAPISGNTGPKTKNAEGNEEKPAPKPHTAAPATTAATAEPDKQPEAEATAPAAPREAAKPQVDPVVVKLNSYAAARGEPKDTARLAPGTGSEAVNPSDDPNAKRKPGDKKKKDTTASTGDTAAPAAAPRPQRPRRTQQIIQPPPGNN